MNFKKQSHYLFALPIALAIGGSAALWAQGNQRGNYRRSANAASYKNEVKIEVKDGFRYITSNGIPDHATGEFPNAGNPNSIAPQSYSWKVTTKPAKAAQPSATQLFGVAINGVPFDPGTAELWNNNFQWHYEALAGYIVSNRRGLGVDQNLAHVQPNGAYHYHGLPYGLLNKLDYKHKMALVGYAVDGFPIYGNYAYADPKSPSSGMKKLKSSYRVKEGNRTDGPGGAYDGSFAQDYEYVKGLGDLDAQNGREGVTPEYPNGTYYYVLTDTFPFVPRQVAGTVDATFRRRGPGGQGGPGQRGPGQGGFGQGGPGQGGPGQGGPGQGGFGQGGPGQGGFGQGGPGFRQGPPRGMVPADALGKYLGLSSVQKAKLEQFKKVIEALESENFAMLSFAELKLTDDQIAKIGKGAKLRSVFNATQLKFLESHQRPQGGPGGGFPGGFPGGPPGGGGPGGESEPEA